MRKIRHQLNREGMGVARYTVARLMKEMSLRGAARGRKHSTTIVGDALDRVNRSFRKCRRAAVVG